MERSYFLDVLRMRPPWRVNTILTISVPYSSANFNCIAIPWKKLAIQATEEPNSVSLLKATPARIPFASLSRFQKGIVARGSTRQKRIIAHNLHLNRLNCDAMFPWREEKKQPRPSRPLPVPANFFNLPSLCASLARRFAPRLTTLPGRALGRSLVRARARACISSRDAQTNFQRDE